MYYLNQTIPEIPPPHLSRNTPPKWRRVSDGHEYEWHDGRIGSLAATVIPPGTSYVGRWSIAVLLDGSPSAVAGGLWHAPNPSLVWFWLIVVMVACLLAAWRLPRPELHARLARVLAVVVLIALAVGGIGRELHGRPSVSIEQLVLTVVVLAFAAWGVGRVLRDRVGFVLDLVIGFVVLWMGFELLSTLVHGFVLTACRVRGAVRGGALHRRRPRADSAGGAHRRGRFPRARWKLVLTTIGLSPQLVFLLA